MTRYPPETLARLYDAILVDDVVDACVSLPDRITIDFPASQLADGMAVSCQLWEAGFDPARLAGLARTLAAMGDLSPVDRADFKHIRAKFKHLRFAFVLYGANHRCPLVFKAATTAMGHLQDAFRHHHLPAVRRHAALLRWLLTNAPLRAMHREVGRVRLTDSAGFRVFTLREIDRLRHLLDQPWITAPVFHAARKIVSRQVSFQDDMRTIHHASEHDAVSRYLSAINGLMGTFHDDLVERKLAGMDYARARITLPPPIRERLCAVVARYPRPA